MGRRTSASIPIHLGELFLKCLVENLVAMTSEKAEELPYTFHQLKYPLLFDRRGDGRCPQLDLHLASFSAYLHAWEEGDHENERMWIEAITDRNRGGFILIAALAHLDA